jgi:AraC-like DNA-binding protein
MLHHCVNGERLNRSDIHYQPRNKILLPVPTASDTDTYDRLEAYRAEQALLQMIREGDVQYRKAVSKADHLFNAQYSDRSRSFPAAVTEATVFATLCIREAITAGISADTAFAVGEGYIDSMRQCRSFSELTSLTLTMYEDFIFRVRKNRTNPAVSSQIRFCRDYIELHAQQELKLSDLAKRAGYSEYYLSRKFKQEMGMPVSSYIRLVRVERSKLMLSTTSVPIHQIADALHFASSSHFSEAFREIVGKTPQQYRLDNRAY